MNTKPIINFEGLYTVSEDGVVTGLKRIVNYRIKGMTRVMKERVIKPTINTRGYLQLSLCKNGVVYSERVHKLVAETFLGNKPKGKEIAHLDGNKLNNHVNNLAYVTHKENESHKKIHGTLATGKKNGRYTKPESTPRGEKHHASKLTWKKVKQIRKSKQSSRELAKKYKVSHANILNIKNNKIWSI